MFLLLIYAGMMELVDMRDLGSRAVMRWGSSPHARTITVEQGFMTEILALQFYRNKIRQNRIVYNTER